MRDRRRAWCATCRFPMKDEFTFGTAFADGHEAARQAIEAALATVFPILPDILAVIPGQLVFQSEASNA